MHRQAVGLAFLVLVMVLPSVMARPDTPEDEKLYGTWLVTTIEVMGNKVPAPADKEPMIVFSKGGKTLLKETGQTDEVGTWKVAIVKNVKEIDLSKKEGVLKGIYQLDGDTLKIAISPNGAAGDRPAAFDPKAGVIMTFKRKKS